jgi:citrate lyase synthetase
MTHETETNRGAEGPAKILSVEECTKTLAKTNRKLKGEIEYNKDLRKWLDQSQAELNQANKQLAEIKRKEAEATCKVSISAQTFSSLTMAEARAKAKQLLDCGLWYLKLK